MLGILPGTQESIPCTLALLAVETSSLSSNRASRPPIKPATTDGRCSRALADSGCWRRVLPPNGAPWAVPSALLTRKGTRRRSLLFACASGGASRCSIITRESGLLGRGGVAARCPSADGTHS